MIGVASWSFEPRPTGLPRSAAGREARSSEPRRLLNAMDNARNHLRREVDHCLVFVAQAVEDVAEQAIGDSRSDE
jgi:hypothetical protein